MVEIFRTDIEVSEKDKLVALLSARFPEHEISIDLDDCDKVLRIQGEQFRVHEVIEVMSSNGKSCEVL